MSSVVARMVHIFLVCDNIRDIHMITVNGIPTDCQIVLSRSLFDKFLASSVQRNYPWLHRIEQSDVEMMGIFLSGVF